MPPVNDNLANARIIRGTVSYLGETTVGATSEISEVAAGFGDPSVHYRLEWPTDGVYRISVANSTGSYYFQVRRPTRQIPVGHLIPDLDDLDETFAITKEWYPANFSQTVGEAFRSKQDATDATLLTPKYAAGTVRYVWLADVFTDLGITSFDISFEFIPAGSAPSNDDITGAPVVTTDTSFTGQTTLNATYDAAEGTTGFNPYPTVWYRLEFPSDGRWIISVSNATDGYDYLGRSATVDPPASYADTNYAGPSFYQPSGADGTGATARYQAGKVLYVWFQAAAFDGSSVESFDIDFTFDTSTTGPPPANDNVANAIEVLASGNTDSVIGTTVDASIESGFEDGPVLGYGYPAVWYAINPTVSGRLVLTVTKASGTDDFRPEADVWRVPTHPTTHLSTNPIPDLDDLEEIIVTSNEWTQPWPPRNADDWVFVQDIRDDGGGFTEYEIPLHAGSRYYVALVDGFFDNFQSGSAQIDFKVIPSPLNDSFEIPRRPITGTLIPDVDDLEETFNVTQERGSIDGDVWFLRRNGSQPPTDPNVGMFSVSDRHAFLGTQSLKQKSSGSLREQLIYWDASEGGSQNRDYWIAYCFYIENWNDIWISNSGEVDLPALLESNQTFPPFGTSLASQRFGSSIFATSSSTGTFHDDNGVNHTGFSAGSWHEVRTRYRRNSATGRVSVTQILDGVTILSNVDVLGTTWNGRPWGIAWETLSEGANTGVNVWVDPLVWRPDTDPGGLTPAGSIGVPVISSTTTLYPPTFTGAGSNANLTAPFIPDNTQLFTPGFYYVDLFVPFIGPTTTLYPPAVQTTNIFPETIGPNTILWPPLLSPIRVTQAGVEVLLFPTDAAGRVSQEPVEALLLPTDARVRGTQVPVEVLVKSTDAGILLTQAVVEVLILPTDAKVRDTVQAVEVLRRRQVGSVSISIID